MASLTNTTDDDDLEEQADELEALQSIYPDLIQVISTHPTIFEVAIEVRLGGPLPVVLLPTNPNNKTSTASTASTSTTTSSTTGLQVSYVTPIILRVQYCPGYPSQSPPHLELHAAWLDNQQREALQAMLHTIWLDEYEGSPVVYGYIDCLSSRETFAGTVRHITAIDEQSIPNLIRYDQIKAYEAFQTTTHTCPVCYDDFLGENCFKLDHCQHFSCRSCFKEYILHHLAHGSVEHLTCFNSTCTYQLMTNDIVRGTDQETANNYDRIQLQKTLDGMSDVVYCPKRNCATPCIEETDQLAQCPKCKHSFCTLCYDAWHPGIKCMDPEMKVKLLKARMNADGSAKNGKEVQAARMAQIHEQMSLSQIKKMSKQCPSCKAAVSKTAGCNKMSCLCGCKFCYTCNADITTVGYEHFYAKPSADGKSKIAADCDLFDTEALLAWNREMGDVPNFQHNMQNGRYGNNVGYQVGIMVKCPRCKQNNAPREDKNNLIRCWACNSKFCAICRKFVSTVAAHYAKGKCPMHGPKRDGGESKSSSNTRGENTGTGRE